MGYGNKKKHTPEWIQSRRKSINGVEHDLNATTTYNISYRTHSLYLPTMSEVRSTNVNI